MFFFGFWQNFNLLWVLVMISGRSAISCGFEVLADLQPPGVFGFWSIFNLLWFFGFCLIVDRHWFFVFWPIFNLLWFLGSVQSSISCLFLGSGRSSISCGFEVLADLQPSVVFGFWPIFNPLWYLGFWPIFNLLWFLGSG